MRQFIREAYDVLRSPLELSMLDLFVAFMGSFTIIVALFV
jgi:chaperone required for assembly of F1-ATPase